MACENGTTARRDADPFSDQYADGVAAATPQFFSRTPAYKQWLSSVVAGRSGKTVLDAACGNGVDSIQLLEEGYEVVSTDFSEPMLDAAREDRQRRRYDAGFSNWVIGQANWLTLPEDLRRIGGLPKDGFDVVLCLGNSFCQLPDFEGTKQNQKTALVNMFAAVKPGGVLILDHRNYDDIIDKEIKPVQSVYYNTSGSIVDVDVSWTYADNKPIWVTLDYKRLQSSPHNNSGENQTGKASGDWQHFLLSYYPHRLVDMNKMLEDTLGVNTKHTIQGDFMPLGVVQNPGYYAHIIEKST